MEYRIVFHPKAETELDQLYDDIADPCVAGDRLEFRSRHRDHFLSVSTFPQCGTERVEIMPGPRVIGYRRALSIAFAVDADRVVILGVFFAGRNITAELLEGRL
ncbi:type II toxin-antitoxin system RelE/ParE family toxin [Mesorhizobium sp. M0615]|uniref:type II toxin-antitoxin system RelE/ParE family toxin n=1 Tax=unclassified Mesorhizobium TaxID=325217 RepID=UPI000422FFA3|nr:MULTISPECIES: type II toxin-antitoxin system RelE/ParE family toxin [unclassified Mesorhizobium]